MTIKHLVIAGGGQTYIQTLGAVYHLVQQGFLDMQDIETIYGTSAGALIGTILAMKFDFETVNNYILKRPWHKVFPLNIQSILGAYNKKGIYDEKAFKDFFKPLFDVKDISLEISLKEFYEKTQVDLHVFTFEMTEFKKVDLSHLTHPDLSLIQALHMSSALPIVFSPIFMNGKCYIDGGLTCNYPLRELLETGINEDEVLGFCNNYKKDNKSQIGEDSNLINFIVAFFFKLVGAFATDNIQKKVANEVRYDTDSLNVDVLMDALYSAESRQILFKSGEEAAAKFLKKLNHSVDELI